MCHGREHGEAGEQRVEPGLVARRVKHSPDGLAAMSRRFFGDVDAGVHGNSDAVQPIPSLRKQASSLPARTTVQVRWNAGGSAALAGGIVTQRTSGIAAATVD
jgi:hypothetical protein